MKIETKIISDVQLSTLLKMNEGHFLDFNSKDIKPNKITRTISSFANASGGEKYIGLSEVYDVSGTHLSWNGFSNDEEANGLIQSVENLKPTFQALYVILAFVELDQYWEETVAGNFSVLIDGFIFDLSTKLLNSPISGSRHLRLSNFKFLQYFEAFHQVAFVAFPEQEALLFWPMLHFCQTNLVFLSVTVPLPLSVYGLQADNENAIAKTAIKSTLIFFINISLIFFIDSMGVTLKIFVY